MNEEIRQAISDLEEAAYYEGSECGQWWDLLISINHYISYCCTPEFREAWEKEIIHEHEKFKKNFYYEDVPTTMRSLKHIDE